MTMPDDLIKMKVLIHYNECSIPPNKIEMHEFEGIKSFILIYGERYLTSKLPQNVVISEFV
jgi:hypothetical protein